MWQPITEAPCIKFGARVGFFIKDDYGNIEYLLPGIDGTTEWELEGYKYYHPVILCGVPQLPAPPINQEEQR